MIGFDLDEYKERLAQSGRPSKAVAAWSLCMFAAILALGLGLAMAGGETIACRPRGHVPELSGIDRDTINPGHRNDWVPRIDPREASEADEAADAIDPRPAPPTTQPPLRVTC